MEKNPDFDLGRWFSVIEKEARSYGMNVSVVAKQKTAETAIHSAFLKGNTREHLLLFLDDSFAASKVPTSKCIAFVNTFVYNVLERYCTLRVVTRR